VILVHPSGSLLKHHEPPYDLLLNDIPSSSCCFFPSWMVTITRGAWWSKTTPKRINGAVHLVWVFSHRHWMQELLVDHPEGVVGWHCSSWGGRPGQLWLMGQWIFRKVVLSWKGWHFWCASVWANLTLIALKTHQRWRLGFPMTIRYLAPTAALLVEVIDTQVNLRCTMPLCKLGHFRQVEVK